MRYTLFLIFLVLCSISFTCQKNGLNQNTNPIENLALQSPNKTPPTPNPSLNQNSDPTEWTPSDYSKHLGKGANIWAVGKFPEDMPEALAEFRKAADIKPTDTLALEWMIKIYTRLEDYKNVTECYREIMRRDPKYLGAEWGLAYVLVWHLGEYEEGLKHIKEVKAKDKPTAITYVYDKTIARAYEGLKDYPNAIKHYKIWLKGSNAPYANEDKEVVKKIAELEKFLKNSNNISQ